MQLSPFFRISAVTFFFLGLAMNLNCTFVLAGLDPNWKVGFCTALLLSSSASFLLNGSYLWLVVVMQHQFSRLENALFVLSSVEFFVALVLGPYHIAQTILPHLAMNDLADAFRKFLTAALASLDFYILGLLSFERYYAVSYTWSTSSNAPRLRYLVAAASLTAAFIPAVRLVPHPVAGTMYYVLTIGAGTTVATIIIVFYIKIWASYRRFRMRPSPVVDRSLLMSLGRTIVIHVLILSLLLIYHVLLLLDVFSCLTLAKYYVLCIILFLSSGFLHPLMFAFQHRSTQDLVSSAFYPPPRFQVTSV